MPYFDPSIIQNLVDHSDIVTVLENYLTLIRKGQNYFSICPFHNEKTPSFSVNPSKQIFYCFGCGIGGNALRFIQLIEKISFPEAVVKLAEITQFALPEKKNSLKNRDYYQRLYDVNQFVLDFYIQQAKKEQHKMDNWLKKRGLSSYTKDLFKLGLAPGQWSLLNDAIDQTDFKRKDFLSLGLIAQSKSSSFYDRFRDRIIFPILDKKSKVIGFGGRVLQNDKKNAKYLNSPESPIYHKGKTFYGVWLTEAAIREKNSVIIVEGYMDLITLYQSDIKNVLATLGTALTVYQARALKKMCNRVFLLYDSDIAGLKASYRAIEVLLPMNLNVKIVRLKNGEDPDNVINNQGIEFLKKRILNAQNAIEFRWQMIKQVLLPKENLTMQVLEMLNFLNHVDDSLLKEQFIDQVSFVTEIDRKILFEKVNTKQKKEIKSMQLQTPLIEISSEEKILLTIALQYSNLYIERIKHDISLDILKTEHAQKILQKLFDFFMHEDFEDSQTKILIEFQDSPYLDLISELYLNNLVEDQLEIIYCDCEKKIKIHYLEERIKRIQSQIYNLEKNSQGEDIQHLLQKLEQLILKKKKLKKNS